MDVTGRSPQDPAEPDLRTAEPAEAASRPDEPVRQSGEPAGATQPPRRPSPGPSPTSRARRVAATGGMAATGGVTRRPSPRPHAGTTTGADPATAERATAGAATAEPVTVDPVTAEPAASGRAFRRPSRAKAAGTEPAAEPRSAQQAPLWLVVLLGVLVLAAAAAVVLAATLPSRSGSTGERDRALSAAKSEVPLILSYNYASFDADLAKAKAQLTGRAVSDYVTAMTKTIKPAAVKVKAVVQAQTDGAGVESVAPDGRQVTVVVFGEQKVTNTSLTAPRTDLFRVRATLDLVGGQWLISKFDQI